MEPEPQRGDVPPAEIDLGELYDLRPRNEFSIVEHAEILLRDNFPNLLDRLKSATAPSLYANRFAEFAAEHFLTTEALVEVLEETAGVKLPENELETKFEDRVVEKAKSFSGRPMEDQKLIKRVYPFVDPHLLGLAFRGGVISARDVVMSLQYPPIYFEEVLPRLGVPENTPKPKKSHR